MTRLLANLAIVWRLASPYFRSEDRWLGRILLAAVIALELAQVGLNVVYNRWNATFFNALQERDWDTFVSQLTFFCFIAAGFIVLGVYQIYLRQWLQIRWRTWMTKRYLDHWLVGANHYRMQLLGDAADNPDQRIADDINMFVERALLIGVRLFGAVVSLLSFVAILWTLSDTAPFHLFGYEIAIPGHLVWAALIYAVLGTTLTHLVGRVLIALNFQQQRYEADFRFNLVRVRENSEQIALLHGEAAEDRRLMDRFGRVITNWRAIMTRTKRLTFLTASYQQIAIVFPYIVVSPAYFAKRIELGGLMQTAQAFGTVQESLSIIVTIYSTLAEWAAVIERLDGFDAAIEAARKAAHQPPVITVAPAEAKAVGFKELLVSLPNGEPLIAVHDFSVSAGERILVTGASGAGKSTLFRAVAGIWPFGTGHIDIPKDSTLMLLPQRPYFPIARLDNAVAYPAEPGSIDSARVAEAIKAVGLPALAVRIDEEAHWNRMLSLGEQQRLGIARALLHAPDILFLDEATASLDDAAEAALYRLIEERLPKTTLVSIGHRSTLNAFHRRGLTLVRDGERSILREAKLQAAE